MKFILTRCTKVIQWVFVYHIDNNCGLAGHTVRNFFHLFDIVHVLKLKIPRYEKCRIQVLQAK